MAKNPPAMQETWVWSLGWEDPLEKGLSTYSIILAWRIPWKEEPGGLQSMGLQRIGYDWATSFRFTSLLFHWCLQIYIKGNDFCELCNNDEVNWSLWGQTCKKHFSLEMKPAPRKESQDIVLHSIGKPLDTWLVLRTFFSQAAENLLIPWEFFALLEFLDWSSDTWGC